MYAVERAQLLFGGYRRGDANDPDRYVTSIAAVLACYDVDTIREVTDPRTGINTQPKFLAFMPNAGEVKIYCDEVSERSARRARYRALPAPGRNTYTPSSHERGCFAIGYVSPEAPQYAALCDRAASPEADPRDWKRDPSRPGIWVAYDWMADARRVGSLSRFDAIAQAARLRQAELRAAARAKADKSS